MSDPLPQVTWQAPGHPVQRALSDTAIMVGRSLRLARRNVDALLIGLALPVLLLLVFVYLFGGAMQTGTDYLTYIVPGVIVLCASYGAAGTAVGVSIDMTNGIMDRFRSMAIVPSSVLAGHVVASLLRNLLSAAIVVVVAVLIGFRPAAGPLDWAIAIGLVALFVVAISWLSAAIGCLVGGPEAAGGFSFFVLFVPYLSSAFVPIDTLPSWLQPIAEHQPMTPMIEAVRSLLGGGGIGGTVGLAAAWWAAIGVASALLAAHIFAIRRG